MADERLFPATMMPDKDWWHTLWPDPEAVLRTVGIENGMDVVDLCCGDGHFTKHLCQLVDFGRIWALELDATLLASAQQACRNHANFHPILGDARELAERLDTPADCVFIANTFHGVPDKSALVKAVYASLKEGGRFAVINWHRRPREETRVLDRPRGPDTALRMTPENVRQIVEPAGLRFEKVANVGPFHYGAVFLKPSESS